MKYDLGLEINFHDQDHASVLVTSALVEQEELDAKLMLFSLFACRQLMNLGAGNTADSLGALLCHCGPEEVGLLANHDGANGPALVAYQGAPGRVRFSAQLCTNPVRFTANSKGMGALAKGAGYYSPNSVLLLLRHLAKQFQDNPTYLQRLALTAHAIGQAHGSGQLTLRSQGQLAMIAVGWAMSEVEAEDTESESFADPSELSTDAASAFNDQVAGVNELQLVDSLVEASNAGSDTAEFVDGGRAYELALALAPGDLPREFEQLNGGTPLEQAAPPRSLFCIECGTTLPQVAKFCLSCGTPVVFPAPLDDGPVSEARSLSQEAMGTHDDLTAQMQPETDLIEPTSVPDGDDLDVAAESLPTSEAKPVSASRPTEPARTPATGGWHAPASFGGSVPTGGGWRIPESGSSVATALPSTTQEEPGTLEAPVSKKAPWGLIAVCLVLLAVFGLAVATSRGEPVATPSGEPSGAEGAIGATASLSAEDRAIITGLESFSSRWNSAAAPVIADYYDQNVSAEDWLSSSSPVLDDLRGIIDGFETDVSRISNNGVRNVLLGLNDNYTDKFNGLVDLHNAVRVGDQNAESQAVGEIKAAADEGQRLALALKEDMRPFLSADDLNSLF